MLRITLGPALFLGALYMSYAVAAVPDGWSEQHQRDVGIYTRLGLPSGKGLVVLSRELIDVPEASRAARFDQAAASYAKGFGGPVTREGKTRLQGSMYLREDRVQHPQSGDITVQQFGVPADGDRLRLFQVMVSSDAALIRAQQPAIAALMTSLAGSESGAGASARPKRKASSSEAEFAYSASPGQGLSERDIAGVAYEAYGTTTGTGDYSFIENTWLLLKDGTAYVRELPVGPADFDAAASKRGEPDQWRPYKLDGGTLEVQNAKGKWVSHAVTVHHASASRSLSGVYEYGASYGSGGLGSSTRRSVISFTAQGEFETSDLTLHTSGTQQRSSGFSGYSSKQGTQSGRYEVDGYTLRLHYADGSTQSRLFFVWNGRPDNLYIGGRTYSKPGSRSGKK